jgi:endonuclease III
LSVVGEEHRRENDRWRERLADRVSGRQPVVPASARRAVEVLGHDLLEITRLLANAHGTPDLGNKVDPVDELVYIILSRRTREGAYQAAFNELKLRYPQWELLADAPIDEIEGVVGFSGLGRRKAQSLKLALRALIEQFGSCTLEPTRSWSDEQTMEFLCELPEVGPKSAACVMMCSLDRPAFPVDAHVGRVLERVGVFRGVGIELSGVDHKVKQRLLRDAVPPALRYPLHVNALVHGRLVCVPAKPRCAQCVLVERCAYASQRSGGPVANSSRGTD